MSDSISRELLLKYFYGAMGVAEELFGQRDTDFFLCDPVFTHEEQPFISYDPCRKWAWIEIPERIRANEYYCALTIAHESVHLLNPIDFQNCTVLEEGIAEWFSEYYIGKCGGSYDPRKSNPSSYREAYSLAKELLSLDQYIISKIRNIQRCSISLINKEMLMLSNPLISLEFAAKLTSLFTR